MIRLWLRKFNFTIINLRSFVELVSCTRRWFRRPPYNWIHQAPVWFDLCTLKRSFELENYNNHVWEKMIQRERFQKFNSLSKTKIRIGILTARFTEYSRLLTGQFTTFDRSRSIISWRLMVSIAFEPFCEHQFFN